MEFVEVGNRGKFHSTIYHKLLHSIGMEDPLCDSKTKLAMFREHCRGILTKEIDAGHRPHDEKPNEVNSIILEWVASIESEVSPVASSQ